MHRDDDSPAGTRPAWPLVAAVMAAAIAIGFGWREHSQKTQLEERRKEMTAGMVEMQKQIQDLSGRLASLTAAHQQTAEAVEEREKAVPAPAAAPEPAHHAAPRTVAVRRAPAPRAARRPVAASEDPRLKQLQGQLSEQAERLARTQQQVDRNREELEGKLNSTKDELGGSIARTHEELVALQKRGERTYTEFQLDKSKEFRRVGQVSLALRKADTKHKRYDMELIVDDVKLQKKGVNLYEPVYLTLSDRPQPLELVVNQITKNHVQGYVSMPRYTRSELTATSTSRTPMKSEAAR
jgi:predicted  nucleic acid-binding Zn-ribbon protein